MGPALPGHREVELPSSGAELLATTPQPVRWLVMQSLHGYRPPLTRGRPNAPRSHLRRGNQGSQNGPGPRKHDEVRTPCQALPGAQGPKRSETQALGQRSSRLRKETGRCGGEKAKKPNPVGDSEIAQSTGSPHQEKTFWRRLCLDCFEDKWESTRGRERALGVPF